MSKLPAKGRPGRSAAPKARKAPVAQVPSADLQDELARRTRERDEALEQQAATAEVLKVISRSAFELRPALEALLESAMRLCGATRGHIYRFDGQALRFEAARGALPGFTDYLEKHPLHLGRGSAAGRAAAERHTVHVHDVLKEAGYEHGDLIKKQGFRTMLAVPMLREDRLIGVITIIKTHVDPFTEKQIELVETFADQAVIAIENVRLFEAEQQRSRELAESLEHQTAMGEVLNVISRSPTDAQPVFDAIAQSATRLCGAVFGIVYLYDGELLHVGAESNLSPEVMQHYLTRFPMRPDRSQAGSRAVLDCKIAHVADTLVDLEYSQEIAKAGGWRAVLGVPMLRDGKPAGSIAVGKREPGPFSERQVQLLKSFADQAVIAIENVRLFEAEQERARELTESLEQQTATSDVLEVISSSPGDLAPVFEAMLESAVRICGAKFGNLFLREGDALRIGAIHGAPQAYVDYLRGESVFSVDQLSPELGVGRLVHTKQSYQVADVAAVPTRGDKLREATIELAGARTVIGVPMLKDDDVVGAIVIYRQEVKPFTEKQIALLENFAAQAVIAIENTRLLSELRESLEQQTGTAEVLRVISSSPGELQPVFDTMLAKATELCEASYGAMWLWDGNGFRNAAIHGDLPQEYVEQWRTGAVIRPGTDTPMMRVVQTRAPVQVADLRETRAYRDQEPLVVAAADVAGVRTLISVPMFKAGEVAGVFTIYRKDVRPFSDKQIALVTNFASQAVIAIENSRLLSELRESLEQQTATAEVLGVISSSPGELKPVFDTILDSATRICEADFGTLLLCDGDDLRAVALHGGEEAYAQARQREPVFRPAPNVPVARAIKLRQMQHVPDLRTEPAYVERDRAIVTMVETAGARTLLAVPMIKDENAVGAIIIYRQEVRPFTDKQVALVENFAAQAVIAIENTRLLTELRERTDDLTEALEQQTATSEVLRIISSSPGELAPVFNAMLENATRLCGAKFGNLWLREGVNFRIAATHGAPSAYQDYLRREPLVNSTSPGALSHIVRTKQVIQIADIKAEPTLGSRSRSAIIELAGGRTLIGVPMLKDDELIGAIVIYRTEVQPFNDKQVELITNFAAQAVIAIENTRLLSELRESLEQQTATSEVLEVISSSPGALEPVFGSLLANATKLCEASYGAMWLRDGGVMRNVSFFGELPEAFSELWHAGSAIPVDAEAPVARCVRTGVPVYVPDLKEDEAYRDGNALARGAVDLAGIRTLVAVPLLKEGGNIGAITIYRREVKPFADKQVQLVANFAAQAVIAIENARLLNELRQRTDDLTESLEQQTATSDVLKVISSSPGELEPVFRTMLENATRICEAKFGALYLREGDAFRRAALKGLSSALAGELQNAQVRRPAPNTVLGRIIATSRTVHIADVTTEPGYFEVPEGFTGPALTQQAGARSMVGVPMLKDNALIGAITVYRQEARPFTDKQIALVTNFAAQAVIAVENARLLNELRESLEQQTATSEVLSVISSSPGELQPVFEAMLENATRICEAAFGTMLLAEGDGLRRVALHNAPLKYLKYHESAPFIQPKKMKIALLNKLIETKKVVHVADMMVENADDPIAVNAGARTLILVPMLKDNNFIGAIGIYRQEVRPFTDKQIALVTNFAAQAVIAIENTRLLNELRQRTDDLTEALEQQTATGEILASISGSLADTQPVFDAIVRNLLRLFGTRFAVVQVLRDGMVYMPAVDGAPGFEKLIEHYPRPLDDTTGGGVAMLGKQVVQYAPIKDNAAVPQTMRDFSREFGFDATIFAPMLRENRVIGVIGVARAEPIPFTDKQVALIKAFAAQAVIAIENARLFNELRQRTDDLTESLQQQTATSEILEVISNSPTDTQPAFDAIVRSALNLFPEAAVMIGLPDGDKLRAGALADSDPAGAEALRGRLPLPLTREYITSAAFLDQREIDIADAREAPQELAAGAKNFLASGFRAISVMPMMRGSATIGTVNVMRRRPGPLSDKQRELLRTFASQAVIAIENTRLFNELRESLDQQTATSEVLGVISSSPGELEAVFSSILNNAVRICGAKFGNLFLLEGEQYRAVAVQGEAHYAEFYRKNPVIEADDTAGIPLDRVRKSRQRLHIPDMREDASYRAGNRRIVALVEDAGALTFLAVPLLKEGAFIGAIVIYRQEIRPFSEKQIALIENFAAQAVIAIENARLLNELRESLEQQTATSDVLSVMSRSKFDLMPILQSVVDTAARLCRAEKAVIFRLRDGVYQFEAGYSLDPEYIEIEKATRIVPSVGTAVGRAALNRQVVRIDDALSDPDYEAKNDAKVGNVRSMIGVPLMREGEPIGVIALARGRVEPFSAREIELVTTFADQAVIAIENFRLFDEVQARTRELQQLLEYQTATSEILTVISRSPTDAKPVFDVIGERAEKLCDAEVSVVSRIDGDEIQLASIHGMNPDGVEAVRRAFPMTRSSETVTARTVRSGAVVHVPDVLDDSEYENKGIARVAEYRACLGVPMMREGQVIGSIFVARANPGYFTDTQVQLLKTFADQAVIAIGNVRLFDEVRARTEDLQESLQQQTATADVLKVISRSTFDLQTVLQTLVESASRLCDSDKVNITRERNGAFYRAEAYGFSQEFQDYVKDIPIEIERGSGFGRALLEGQVIHIPDVLADPDYTQSEMQKLGDYRTVLAIPMMREKSTIGVLTLTRSEVRPFTDKQIELATTFADQAAIAIENVRLFESVEARTRDLTKSLQELQVAQDRLVQTEKLASLGQLTAGIAHEIKNPLNFVNNFSSISVELIGELRQLLERVDLDPKLRAEIGQLEDMLQGNLDKVVQHGKRADSIVKNMLLHSRQGSGEHRPVDINYLVEESLNLAYHGARAEKQGFNITLERSYDPAAGEVDLYPQEITRVLLNLISNGFYAATKRKAQAQDGYEPTLAVATKDCGGSVEIRVRDNGTGIPPEVKERMFNPFFTTKPAGEGTGLGLSISHDIIAKQHAGSIEVDTAPGEFTEFKIVLPRSAASLGKSGAPT